MTYKNATEHISLQEAMDFYEERKVAVVVDEGKHITLEDEN